MYGIETAKIHIIVVWRVVCNACPFVERRRSQCGITTHAGSRKSFLRRKKKSPRDGKENQHGRSVLFFSFLSSQFTSCPQACQPCCCSWSSAGFRRCSCRCCVPTHIMPRAVLTAKWFRSHRAVFICEKRTAILTMRRTDGSIEIQKGHCRSRLPNNRMKFPPTVWKLKADFSYLSSNDDHQ